MAGSFGLEAEHYATSQAMAGLSLLPALRGAPAETRVIANGFSCRHQIAHANGRPAKHIALLLREALDTDEGVSADRIRDESSSALPAE